MGTQKTVMIFDRKELEELVAPHVVVYLSKVKTIKEIVMGDFENPYFDKASLPLLPNTSHVNLIQFFCDHVSELYFDNNPEIHAVFFNPKNGINEYIWMATND